MVTESNEVDVSCGPVPNAHVGTNDAAIGTAIEESADKIAQSAGTVGVDTVDGDGRSYTSG